MDSLKLKLKQLADAEPVKLADVSPGIAQEVLLYSWTHDAEGKAPPSEVHLLLSFGAHEELAGGRRIGGAVARITSREDCDEIIRAIEEKRDKVFPVRMTGERTKKPTNPVDDHELWLRSRER